MNPPATSKRDWTLTSSAFDQLLLRFHADRDLAGQKYELVRRKLAEFFEARGGENPLDEVDEVINRVARRITEGEQIKDLNAYFYGVARMVWLENLRARDKDPTPLELAPTPVAPNTTELEVERQQLEDRLECLERCLSSLSRVSRTLIVEYYREEKGLKIEHRREQAMRLNTTLNGLRLRASRIRAELTQCIHSCLGEGSQGSQGSQGSETRNQPVDTE